MASGRGRKAAANVYVKGWDRQIAMAPNEVKAMKRQINGETIYPLTGDRAALLAAVGFD